MALDPTLASWMNAGKVQPASKGIGMFGWDDLILGGIGLFGNLFSTKQQTKAADKSADRQAEAIRYAADQQTAANRDALDRAERESALDRLVAETNRRGNYDQWRAREARIGTLGQLAGLPARDIPAYVPLPNGVAPGGATSGGMYPSRPENMPKAGEVDWTSPQLGAQLSAFFKARGVSDSEVPYWVSKAGELVARGKEINNPNYANERLAASDIFGGGGAAPAMPRSAAPVAGRAPMTLRDYAGMALPPALTGQVYLPPSLRRMAGA